MKWIKIILSLLAFLLPVVIVFKSFFGSSQLVWGDAPFFYFEGFRQLISEPLAWTSRGINLGGINLMIWISPLTILYGIVGSFFKLNNDLVIRILFYFPSVILASLGSFILAKSVTKNNQSSFFTSLVYVLNTYFLLIIDGGQVGYALAYGIFPFVIFFLRNLFIRLNLNNFLFGLIALFLCSIADPRVAIIAFGTTFIWVFLESVIDRNIDRLKNLKSMFLVGISWVGLSAYWIFPLIKNISLSQSLGTLISPTTKLKNAILLFSPHWPENVFGQTNSPTFYFILVPFIVFIPLIISFLSSRGREKSKQFVLVAVLYIFFCFLTVSSSLFSKIPFGFAFRDTSKFFIPIILFFGISIGYSNWIVNKKIFTSFLYLYILLLVWQAVLGKMNFNLSNRSFPATYNDIYKLLSNDKDYFRSLWILEKHPLSYDLENKPAINGQGMVDLMPFSYMNAGEDPFNFLNNNQKRQGSYQNWLRVLGIKYIILSGDQRRLIKSTADLNNWQEINTLIEKTEGLVKVNSEIPSFEIKNPYPRFFAVSKVYGVVGKPINNPYMPTLNYQDGLFDPNLMKEVSPKGYSIIFNEGNEDDLKMSYLQKFFKGVDSAVNTEWAGYSHNSYLKYKYELLIRGVKFEDLDYSKGIAFSTKNGEKIEFTFDVKIAGEYMLATRSMNVGDKEDSLTWKFENLNLSKGEYKKTIINQSGFDILNVVALVPKKDFDSAGITAKMLISNFSEKISSIESIRELEHKPLNINNFGNLRYKFENPGESYWIVLTDNFNPLWQIRTGGAPYNSYPLYSTINAFYIDPKWNNLEIRFKGQENVRWGIYISFVSILLISTIALMLKANENDTK